MIPADTLRDLYDYNYWARDRQLEACAALTEEQFLRPMGSSFSSVRDTLAHLVAVEWIWHERWRGRSPNQVHVREFAAETFPTLATIRDRWQAVEGNVRGYLAGLGESALKQPLTYTNVDLHHVADFAPRGEPSDVPSRSNHRTAVPVGSRSARD